MKLKLETRSDTFESTRGVPVRSFETRRYIRRTGVVHGSAQQQNEHTNYFKLVGWRLWVLLRARRLADCLNEMSVTSAIGSLFISVY